MSDTTDPGGGSVDGELGPEEPTPPATPSSADVDPALRALFWRLVVLYKFALLGGTLGVLLLVFDKGPAIGGEVLVGALALLAYALYQTRRGQARLESGEFDDGDENTSGSGDAGTEAGEP